MDMYIGKKVVHRKKYGKQILRRTKRKNLIQKSKFVDSRASSSAWVNVQNFDFSI
jgi:hypothetical protein